MSYSKKPTLSQRGIELEELIGQRLKNEDSKVRERVYQWLNDNQYYVDNELFDFYLCVAQNIAATETLGGSGAKIVKATAELEESGKLYINQLFESLNSVDKQLIARLNSVEKNQKKLDSKLLEVLSAFAREQENLQVISTGLLNSTSLLLKKQNQLMANADLAKKSARISVIIAWIIPAILLLLHLN